MTSEALVDAEALLRRHGGRQEEFRALRLFGGGMSVQRVAAELRWSPQRVRALLGIVLRLDLDNREVWPWA